MPQLAVKDIYISGADIYVFSRDALKTAGK